MRRSGLCLFGNSRLHRSIRKDHAFYHRLLHSQSDAKGKPWILVGRPRVMDGYVGRIHTWLVLYSVLGYNYCVIRIWQSFSFIEIMFITDRRPLRMLWMSRIEQDHPSGMHSG